MAEDGKRKIERLGRWPARMVKNNGIGIIRDREINQLPFSTFFVALVVPTEDKALILVYAKVTFLYICLNVHAHIS